MTVEEIAREFLGRGGKKLRPRLCAAVCASLAADPSATDRAAPLFEAVECFHKASLVHDDVQDGDEVRYGRPTTWKEYGVPLAIAVGDWLVAHGYRLIAESGFANVAEMLCAAVRSHQRLCEGQGDELALGRAGAAAPTEDQVVSIYARKTGEAFALAAQLGALAAGAPAEAVAAARRFGLAYGVAFQIADDLGDGGHLLLDACGGDAARLESLRRAYAQKALHENETALHCDVGPFGLR